MTQQSQAVVPVPLSLESFDQNTASDNPLNSKFSPLHLRMLTSESPSPNLNGDGGRYSARSQRT